MVVPKTKGEILGVVVVESGWGSMLPTVVIANLAPAGAAARCGQLNIGNFNQSMKYIYYQFVLLIRNINYIFYFQSLFI